MQDRDKAYIWDMVSAAEDVVIFTEGMTFIAFEKDKKTRFAVERQLLAIGEAAKHVSDEAKDEFPCIPWRRVIGLRNIIAHEYGEILTERIWNVCINSIPELLFELRNINIDQ